VAVAAWRVEIDAGAGNQRDRPFHRAHDLAERDQIGGPRQSVATLGAARALDEAGALQVEHDQLEIFGRNPLRLGDAPELDRRATRFLGEEQQGPQRITGLLGNHARCERSALNAATQRVR
jgi:hypothetical protein